MRFAQRFCPKCNEEARGTVEKILGVALLDFNEDGDGEYFGETDVDWNTQQGVTNAKGEVMLTCHNGHDWYSRVMPERKKK